MNIPAKTPFAQSLNHPNNHQTSLSADYHIQIYDNSIVDEFGNRKWLLSNLLHRTDGPAMEWTSRKQEWWLNGVLHRENGPALI